MPLYNPPNGPITLSAKNVTINTAASPSDVVIVAIPVGVSRYRLVGSSALLDPALNVIANSFTATMASAAFTVYDGAGATGVNVTGSAPGPSTSGGNLVTGAAVSGNNYYSTSRNLYIRQTADSANAGTVDFYLRILPLG